MYETDISSHIACPFTMSPALPARPSEVATEVCDASPGYIEKNSGWLTSPGQATRVRRVVDVF